MDEEDILNFDFALLRFEVGSYSPPPDGRGVMG